MEIKVRLWFPRNSVERKMSIIDVIIMKDKTELFLTQKNDKYLCAIHSQDEQDYTALHHASYGSVD